MPANTSPIFTVTGNFFPARINRAYTPSDGTTNATLGTSGDTNANLFLLVSAGTDGTRVDAVRFRAANNTSTSTSSAMVHKVFLSDTTGTSGIRLIGEVATATTTRSTTAIGASSIITFDQPIIMRSGQRMYVAQSVYTTSVANNNDIFDAIAFAADY